MPNVYQSGATKPILGDFGFWTIWISKFQYPPTAGLQENRVLIYRIASI